MKVNWEKIHTNFISHLSWLEKLSPIHEFLIAHYYFLSWSPCKKLNVNWEKILMAWETFPYSYTSPHIHSWIFDSLRVIILWVRVTHIKLNVNCMKIHSIILSLTCYGLKNFPLLIHIPSKPFVSFQNPMSYYFLS